LTSVLLGYTLRKGGKWFLRTEKKKGFPKKNNGGGLSGKILWEGGERSKSLFEPKWCSNLTGRGKKKRGWFFNGGEKARVGKERLR